MKKRQRKKNRKNFWRLDAAQRVPWRKRSIITMTKFRKEVDQLLTGYIGTYYNCRIVKENLL